MLIFLFSKIIISVSPATKSAGQFVGLGLCGIINIEKDILHVASLYQRKCRRRTGKIHCLGQSFDQRRWSEEYVTESRTCHLQSSVYSHAAKQDRTHIYDTRRILCVVRSKLMLTSLWSQPGGDVWLPASNNSCDCRLYL